MGLMDNMDDKMHELKGKVEQKAQDSNLDDKAKAKIQEMRNKHDSKSDTDSSM